MPASHKIPATGIRICNGFALVAGLGAKVWVMIGLITVSTEPMPVEISGVQSIIISGLTVSALGIRLSTLSIVNGQINRTATNPQRSTLTHLGAFLKTSLRSNTASTSQLADMLILTIFKKTSLKRTSFIVSLLSGCGRSCAAPHPILRWKCPGVW